MTQIPVIVLHKKPACQACRAVARRLSEAGVEFIEQDLTAPENLKDLEHFKGLGYSSAPITEYGDIAFPGYNPAEVDRVIAKYKEDRGL